MRFTGVVLTTNEESEQSTKGDYASNLYETRGLATISREDTEGSPPKQARRGDSESTLLTLSASNGVHLAVAAGNDIQFFRLGVDLEFVKSFALEDDVCGLEWLPKCSMLLIAVNSGQVFIYSCLSESVVFCIASPSSGEGWQRCWMSCYLVRNSCHVVLIADNGDFLRFQLERFQEFCSTTKKHASIEQSCKDSLRDSRLPCSLRACHFLPGGGILATEVTTGGLAYADDDSFDFLDDMPGGSSAWQSSQPIYGGRYAMGMSVTGELLIYDGFTLMELFRVPVASKGQKILSFILMESPDSILSNSTLAVVATKDDKVEVQVRSLASPSTVAYSVPLSTDASLVELAADSDRVAVFIEHPDFHLLPVEQEIRVREVVQAHPEQRLERLLSRGQLDEAENFATQFKLDLQRVHIARMNSLLNAMMGSDGGKSIVSFMACLDKVEEHDLVGDTCLSAAMFATRLSDITAILEYASKRKITDSDTLSQLHNLSYNLCTYRMLFGPNALFGEDSNWPDYHSNQDWHTVWLQLLAGGLVDEARILWQRYLAEFVHHFTPKEELEKEKDMAAKAFFQVATSLLFDGDVSPCREWKQLLEHAEADVVPTLLLCGEEPAGIFSLFSSLLCKVAEQLEKNDSQRFPQNAREALCSVERMLGRMTAVALTPMKEASLAFTIACISRDVDDILLRVRNLTAIARLKEVYECPLGYQTFISLNSEEICHRILEQSVQNPAAVKVNIDRLARPYMAEHHLLADETLLGYVKKMSGMNGGSSTTNSASEPYILHCLAVSEAISKPGTRGRAVSLVAEGAQPPWPRKLRAAVDSILADKKTEPDLVEKLETRLDECEVGLILMKHALTFGHLKSVLSSTRQCLRFIEYLLAYNSKNETIEERLGAALRIADLYTKMKLVNKEKEVMRDSVHLLYLKQLAVSSQLAKMHEFVGGLEENERERLVDSAIDHLTRVVEMMVPSQQSIGKRGTLIAAILSLITRYRRDDSQKQELHSTLRHVARMQEQYEMWMGVAEMRDKQRKMDILSEFSLRKERTLEELHSIARSLGLTEDEEWRLLINLATSQPGAEKYGLNILGEAVAAHPSGLSPPLLESAVCCLQQCIRALHQLAHTEEGALQCVEMVETMEKVVPELLLWCGEQDEVRDGLLRMGAFLSLFTATTKQLESADDSQTGIASGSSGNEICILGFSRRVGTYSPREDGPIFLAPQAVVHLTAVASAFVPPINTDENEDDSLEMETSWMNLFTFFSGQQCVLELRAKALYSSLRGASINWFDTVNGFAQRLLATHPCDLLALATVVSCLPPSTLENLMKSLIKWSQCRRNSQSTLNALRLAQLFTLKLEKKDLNVYLDRSFAQSLWQKRMAKLGVSTALTDITKTVQDFAALPVQPDTVIEYLSSMKHKIANGQEEYLMEQLRCYAIVLLEKASLAPCNSLLQHKLLTYAEMTMDKDNNKIALYKVLHDSLDRYCPYAHEVILFVLDKMRKFAPSEDSVAWAESCERIAKFLYAWTRHRPIIWEECAWYRDRREMLKTNENEYAVGDVEDEEERALFQKDSMPPLSSRRLPFHIFLEKGEDVLQKSLLQVLLNEFSIQNLKMWFSLLKSVAWLARSSCLHRVNLLARTVVRKCADTAAKGESLEEYEMKEIENELFTTKQHSLLLSSFSSNIKDVKTLEMKIQLLEIGSSVAKKWMTECVGDLDKSVLNEIEDHFTRISQGLSRLRTERLLRSHALYFENTTARMDKPVDLIDLLHSDYVNWDDPLDCEKKMQLMRELAQVNDVRLEEVHSRLIEKWLPHGEASDSAEEVDLDDTMGAMPSLSDALSSSSTDGDELYELPIYQSSITRIVHLIRLRPDHKRQIFNMLGNKCNAPASAVPGGYKTKVRAVCVLLLAFRNDEIAAFGGGSYMQVCEVMELILYERLMEMSIGVDKMEVFKTTKGKEEKEKPLLPFVKTLLSGGQRNRPHVMHLASCIVVDYDMDDRGCVEFLLSKLNSDRKMPMLSLLLKHCRDKVSLRTSKNMNQMWGRTLDWAVSQLDENECEGCELRDWVLFGLSCPAEGGRFLDSFRSWLTAKNAPLAAHLLQLANAFTKTAAAPSLSRREEKLDMHCQWLKAAAC